MQGDIYSTGGIQISFLEDPIVGSQMSFQEVYNSTALEGLKYLSWRFKIPMEGFNYPSRRFKIPMEGLKYSSRRLKIPLPVGFELDWKD